MNVLPFDLGGRPAKEAEAYSTSVVETLHGVLALKDQWLDLERSAGGATLFQSFAWCRNAAEHVLQRGDGKLFICCIFFGGRLIGVLPLSLRRRLTCAVLTGLSEPIQQYTELLVAPGHDRALIAAPIRKVIDASGADYVHLSKVRRDGPLFGVIADYVPPTGEENGAPYVPLRDWPDFDSYSKTVKSKTRKNLRNARNRLLKEGPIDHSISFDGELLTKVIDRTYLGRVEWLSRMGLTSRAFGEAGFEVFLDRFKTPLQSGVRVVAFSLSCGGVPIAEQWGFIHNRRYYAFISTWNTDYDWASPGRLHLGDVIQACFAEDIDVVDFLMPVVPYKTTWAPRYIAVQDHMLPMSLKGRLIAGLWLNVVRPRVKRLMLIVPTGLRKILLNVFKLFEGR